MLKVAVTTSVVYPSDFGFESVCLTYNGKTPGFETCSFLKLNPEYDCIVPPIQKIK